MLNNYPHSMFIWLIYDLAARDNFFGEAKICLREGIAVDYKKSVRPLYFVT